MKSSLLGIPRSLACLSIALAGFTLSAAQETYILASKDQPALVGSILTTETITLMEAGKYVLTIEGEKVEGKNDFKGSELVTTECLSPLRFRRIQKKQEEHTRMEVLDQTVEEPGEKGPLLGIPVILEKPSKDGTFTALMEKGEATEEQKKELAEIAKTANSKDDLVIYGEQSRKPGETWEVDVSKLTDFADIRDLQGTMSLKFIEVKEIGGVRCAVLKCTYELRGEGADDEAGIGEMILKGEDLLHRSLEDLVNLDSKTEGRISMSTKEDADEPWEMKSPMNITVRNTISKAAR